MKRFEILEHKADLKIRVFGKSKEELFENLMIGMFEGARYEKKEKGKRKKSPKQSLRDVTEQAKRKIKIESQDLPSLLVDFLSEILYLTETKKEVYQKVNFKKLAEKEIEAELIGKELKRMGVQVKAVTYHNLDIRQRKDKVWEATVLFDI